MNDLKGKRFGKLVVLEYVRPSSYRKNVHFWKCQCDCGRTKDIASSHLLWKNTKSCGCLHNRKGKDSPFFRGYEEIPGVYYSTLKRGAKDRNYKFLISLKYLWNLFLLQERKCALSGLSIGFDRVKGITASVDRIDSSKGYVEGNIQWVHKDINIMKSWYEKSYFIEMCKKVAAHA